MSDGDVMTVGQCRETHRQSMGQLDRVEAKIDKLEKRLYVDNGTKSVQSRINENASAIVEISKRLDASKTRHGDHAEPADSDANCSEFAFGPFKWKVRGKAGTQMFISTGWRVIALVLMWYIARGVYANKTIAEANNVVAVKAVKASIAAVELLQESTGIIISNEVNNP